MKNTPRKHLTEVGPAYANSSKDHAFPDGQNIDLTDNMVVEELNMLLNERKYLELLSSSAKFIHKTDSAKTHSLIYERLSRACFANGEVESALFFLILAFKNCEYTEKGQLFDRNESLVSNIELEMISFALTQVDSDEVRNALHYQFGRKKFDNEKYTAAKELLDAYIKLTPQHDKTPSAEKMLAHIDAITGVNLRRIGCLLPLSGPYQTFGNKALNGIMFAVNEFNKQNPVSRFEVTVMDTGSELRTISQLVAELDEKRVALIIGPLAKGQEAAVEAQKRNIPIITLTQKKGICDTGDYVFRHFMTARMQVEAILSSAAVNFGIRRFALLYPDEPYGIVFAKLFTNAAPRYGVEIKHIKAYEAGQTDFGDQIRSMVRYKDKSSDPTIRMRNSNRHTEHEVIKDFEALFIPDSSLIISMIAPQLDYHDVNGVLLFGTNLWHSDELIMLAGKYIQEAIVPDIFFKNSSAEAVKRFVSDFQLQFDVPPGFMEAVAYDTTNMAFQALLGPGLVSREHVKTALHNMTSFNGITGRTIFDFAGESQKDLYVLQIIGDRFVELEKTGRIYSYMQR
jgi:ABC-type branched-subunit amino acid transport system substrate-binding protein